MGQPFVRARPAFVRARPAGDWGLVSGDESSLIPCSCSLWTSLASRAVTFSLEVLKNSPH